MSVLLILSLDLWYKIMVALAFPLVLLGFALLPSPGNSGEESSELAEEIANFWRANGWSSIDVFSTFSSGKTRGTLRLFRHLLKSSLEIERKMRLLPYWHHNWQPGSLQNSSKLLLEDGDNAIEHFVSIEGILKHSQAFSALIVTRTEFGDSMLNQISFPIGCFVFRVDNGLTFLKEAKKALLTRKTSDLSRLSLMELPVNSNLEDMAGTSLVAKSLKFEPFFSLGNCPKGGFCNDASGNLHDLMQFVAREGNFSYIVQKDPSGVWEDLPKKASDYSNTTDYSSIQAGLFQGTNDLSLAPWTTTPERFVWGAFSFPIDDDFIHCYVSQKQLTQSSDMSFFLKPMTSEVWACLVALAAVLGTSKMLWTCDQTSSCSFYTWVGVENLLFTLVYAYYCGAQTMFLASKPDLPFQTALHGVTKSSWSVLITEGDNILRHHLPSTAKITALHKKFQEEKLSLEETMPMLENRKTFLLSTKVQLAQRMKEGTKKSTSSWSPLVSFCKPIKSVRALYLPRNSPFHRAIDRGISRLRQNGQFQALRRRLLRDGKFHTDADLESSTKSIDFLTVSLAFLGLALVLALALILLSAEKISSRLKKKRSKGSSYIVSMSLRNN